MFFALRSISNVLKKFKSIHSKSKSYPVNGNEGEDHSSVENVVKNAIDVLRVIEVEPEIDVSSFLCPGGVREDSAEKEGSDADSDEESDDGGGDDTEEEEEKQLQRSVGNKRKKLSPVEVIAAENSSNKKRKTKKSLVERLQSPAEYRKLFSRAWLALLSMPLSTAQHKLILKHLPDFVMPVMVKPLLLADYLTDSYNKGGVLAVLALQSLFQLILHHNLDYPHFFESLYSLCTVHVFGAKYRSKFMSLLHASLKSTNLPGYVAAAFIKRLTRLALYSVSPSALFCLAQVRLCHCMFVRTIILSIKHL